MRLLAGLASALILSACTYVPPAKQISPAGAGSKGSATAPWRKVDAETGQIADLAGLQALAEAFPDSSSVRLRLLQHHAGTRNIAGAVKEALWLAERGYSFSDAGRKQVIGMAGDTTVSARLADLFSRNAKSVERSTLVKTIPASVKLVENVSINPETNMYFISSIVSRDLYFGTGTGGFSAFNLGKIGSLAGMAMDENNQVLWVSSGAYDPTPNPQSAFPGIIGFDMRNAAVQYRLPGNGGSTPSDLHLAKNGSLFASDPISGAVYTVAAPPADLETMIDTGTFRSPQGLTTSSDGEKLYISDYRYGIAVIDLETKTIRRLSSQTPMILDGIDGMWRHGNRLIAVQNGTNPMRIVSIELSPDGMSATNLTVLEQAHPDWTEPLGGTIHNGALYYVATGQWDRFEKGGVPKKDKPPIPTDIRRLPLD